MTEKYTKYWDLIIKEKAGKLSKNELADFNLWKQEYPSDYEDILKMYEVSESEESLTFEPKNEWDTLQTMIKIEEEAKSVKAVKLFPWMTRAAAAAIIIFGLFYMYNRSEPDGQFVMQTMVSTDNNLQKQVELPDGTIVYLNKGSELLYPEQFELNTREVYLKGEAFFDVAHNKEKPFIVHAGVSKTTVLGTSFNLRAYSKEDDIRLTVVSGKVAFTLSDDREKAIVTPGNMASLNRKTKELYQGENHDLNFLSWKTNILIFDDSPMSELILSLEKHFNIDIQVENETTNNCRFTGDFKDTELDSILMIITRTIGSTYNKTNDTYLIAGEGCN